jgi:hypothetical protein
MENFQNVNSEVKGSYFFLRFYKELSKQCDAHESHGNIQNFSFLKNV